MNRLYTCYNKQGHDAFQQNEIRQEMTIVSLTYTLILAFENLHLDGMCSSNK